MSRHEREVGGVLVGVGHKGGARYGDVQRDGRSDLLKDQELNGQNTNRCPFGCYDDELDELGYCYHLIGFSPDGKKLERNVIGEDGRMRTIAPVKKVNGRFTIVHDEFIDRAKVASGEIVRDWIVKGGSCRVYQDVKRPDDYPEHVSDELTDEELRAIDADEDAAEDSAETYGRGERPEQTAVRHDRPRRTTTEPVAEEE